MADCIFCKVATGEIPARIVRRTPDAVAFYDLQPSAPTHVLVIPTKHLGAVRDAKGQDLALLGKLRRRLPSEVATELGLDRAGLPAGEQHRAGRRAVGLSPPFPLCSAAAR